MMARPQISEGPPRRCRCRCFSCYRQIHNRFIALVSNTFSQRGEPVSTYLYRTTSQDCLELSFLKIWLPRAVPILLPPTFCLSSATTSRFTHLHKVALRKTEICLHASNIIQPQAKQSCLTLVIQDHMNLLPPHGRVDSYAALPETVYVVVLRSGNSRVRHRATH